MANFRLSGRRVTLNGDPANFLYTVTIDGMAWTMSEHPYVKFANGDQVPFPAPVSEKTFKTGTTQGICAAYTGFGAHDVSIKTTAEIELLTDDVYFTLLVEGDQRCEIETVSFPAPFDYGEKYGDVPAQRENFLPVSYTVFSFMQGELMPAGVKTTLYGGKVHERDAYLPLFGQVRGDSGYLAIYDTPFDAKLELRYEDGEKVAPMWMTSLGYMAYPRRMLYRFMTHCDHNDMAREFRAYKDRRGMAKTLKEKFARNPQAEKLVGCPVIHSGIVSHRAESCVRYTPDWQDIVHTFAERTEQIKALHAKGLKKAYTHFDGWGNHGYDNLHPDVFPPHEAAGGWDGMRELGETVNACGYIFGIHDQYRDYYYDAETFDFENAVTKADGSHPFNNYWAGGQQSMLCSALAPRYVRRNYDTFDEMKIPVKAAYLDVFSVVEMDECFHPDHPATREQCAANRREALEVLTEKGIIPSSEETLDCILPAQVLCHHAPFHCLREPHLTDGIPIPLLNMVYHDCVITPWIGRKGERGGWGVPKNDTSYVHAWLNGSPQYLNITADEEEIAEVEATCAHAAKLVHEKIVRHEFLSADMRSQRTTFSDGTVVEVNFDTEEITVK